MNTIILCYGYWFLNIAPVHRNSTFEFYDLKYGKKHTHSVSYTEYIYEAKEKNCIIIPTTASSLEEVYKEYPELFI